ncbi:MAG TPA: T9SS type A sorting domain-containing protein, partial [Rubricoccaceae bacterium]|nr:T9SS type A sorting domain-containing protein [Rubricoccaceae bacterium]
GNVYPIGRFRIIDVAGDATPPPPGTTIRILTSEPKIVAAEPPVSGIPEAYTLRPVYPNPTRGRAVVPFVVPTAGRVRVAVYDVLGREVAVLADGLHGAGAHEAVLDGAGLASGVYVVVLEGEAARATRKLTILR